MKEMEDIIVDCWNGNQWVPLEKFSLTQEVVESVNVDYRVRLKAFDWAAKKLVKGKCRRMIRPI